MSDWNPVDFGAYRNIVFLTGAGISQASGLGTYRGPGGLWDKEDLAKYAHVSILDTEPEGIWKTFGPLRQLARTSDVNTGHLAVAALEDRLSDDQTLTIITQNVDGLHQRAGSKDVIELHGNIHRTKCAKPSCRFARYEDEIDHLEDVPYCSICGNILRPDIVLFGEMLPEGAMMGVDRALRKCDLFIAVGTSGTVMPAALFVAEARENGARTILVNLEPSDPPNRAFDEEILGRSEVLLPTLFSM